MTQELHYTSVPRGLKPGTRGFCTVACTAGLSPTLSERLEGLSGYRPIYPPHHPEAALNPIAWSHMKISAVGQTASVLSRVGPAGLDYTERPNKYAHHVVLESKERPAGGPAWLLSQPGFMASSWEGAPQVLPEGRRPPEGDRPAGVCQAWAERVGDGGWAGVMAESFLADPKRPAILICDPNTDVLGLFVEAMALLPPERRWDVTFSTYFTGLPAGMTCAWRGVFRDTPEERLARGNPEALILDLGRPIGNPKGGALVTLARTGERVDTSPRAESVRESLPSAPLPLREIGASERHAPPTAPSAAYQTSHPHSMGGGYILETPVPAPPALSKQRRSTALRGSRSGWSSIAAVAIAFLIGTMVGGGGVAMVLYHPDRNSTPIFTLSKTNRPLETAGGPSDSSRSKVRSNTSKAANGEPTQPLNSNLTQKDDPRDAFPNSDPFRNTETSKPKKLPSSDGQQARNNKSSEGTKTGPPAESTKPSPSASSPPNQKEPLPISKNPRQPNEQESVQATQSKPNDARPPIPTGPLQIESSYILSTESVAESGTKTNQLDLSGRVERLKLFGKTGSEQNLFAFEVRSSTTILPDTRMEFEVKETSPIYVTIGKFVIADQKIKLEWDDSNSLSVEGSKAFSVYLLEIIYTEGYSKYFMIRDPKFKALPNSLSTQNLKSIGPDPKKKRQASSYCEIEFHSQNFAYRPTSRLHSFRFLNKDDTEFLRLTKEDSSNKLTAQHEDHKIEAWISEGGKIRVNVEPPLPPWEQTSPNMNRLASARLEAQVAIVAENKELLLPTLKSATPPPSPKENTK